ncbi:glycosyltransferase family 25 protein [Aminobacter sp. BA135]|uniref:glycosyltransferase family 25 protein n=1 Tax=Aminobacter sp. BA135 TaxID=537596 RepID=UPI003D7BF349
MRLFVINLDAATDRLQWMSDSFASLGLDFERIAAIDKNNLRDDHISHVVGTGWTGGELGCFLSHIEAWKVVASGTDEFGCIFEDDVHLAPDATRFLKDSNWIPQGLDLIELETTLNPIVPLSPRTWQDWFYAAVMITALLVVACLTATALLG